MIRALVLVLVVAICAFQNAHAARLARGATSYSGNGQFSWYNDVGYGSCGTQIDASSQLLAAVPWTLWTASNPNNDPLCKKCVKATYKGKTLTVPIKDKCPGCSADKVDLSKPAFAKLENLDVGIMRSASWSIVSC